MRTTAWTLLAGALLACPVVAQIPKSAFLPADSQRDLAFDGPQVWTLHFAYIPPRIATIKTPDRGEKTVWYMPYYVRNETGAPRTFLPEFELVIKDPDPKVVGNWLDESQPSVVDALKKIEGPKDRHYHTSVSIARNKIPVALPDTFPESQGVYGIAVWLDVPELANPNRFSVYVTGLSDGLTKKEVEDKGVTKVQISKKTLQLDFNRLVGTVKNKSDDIKPNDNNGTGAEKWIYRQTAEIVKGKAAEPKDPK